MEVGSKVMFINAEDHKKHPDWWPPVGTIGTAAAYKDRPAGLLIQWPAGTTSFDDCWVSDEKDVEEVK